MFSSKKKIVFFSIHFQSSAYANDWGGLMRPLIDRMALPVRAVCYLEQMRNSKRKKKKINKEKESTLVWKSQIQIISTPSLVIDY